MFRTPSGTTKPDSPQMSTDRVGESTQLADKEIPRPMAHRNHLLRLGLDQPKAHRGPDNSGADGLPHQQHPSCPA